MVLDFKQRVIENSVKTTPLLNLDEGKEDNFRPSAIALEMNLAVTTLKHSES